MPRIYEVSKSWREELQQSLILSHNEASIECDLLFQEALKVDRVWLIKNKNEEISSYEQFKIEDLLKRRALGEPIAYILGKREFYGLPLKTTPATLIPRPDTETLVETALDKISPHQNSKILDLGTGTGAIALAIAKNRPQAEVTAVDFSAEALTVAQENAQNLDLVRVCFLQSHWFASLQNEKFDVIVSNPPYIAENDVHLRQGDLRFEPLSALASGKDGLDDIRHIIREAPSHLNPNGWLMLEHGYDQAEKVAELVRLHGFGQISHVPDLSGTLRVTLGRMPQ